MARNVTTEVSREEFGVKVSQMLLIDQVGHHVQYFHIRSRDGMFQ